MSASIRIGDYEISVIDDHIGAPRVPTEVFVDVPARAWDPYRSFALDHEGRWQAQWRGHLIRRIDGSGPSILVDTGMGAGPHAHTGRGGELLDNLRAVGRAQGDIDVVVTTHCHGDHVGWNISGGSPTFPNARYHIARNDWEHYSNPENANPAFDENVWPLQRAGYLDLVSGEVELAPGVRTYPANGHTPGHQCVLVESGGETAILTGDLFHNVAQVSEQTWCPVFDWNTDMSTASRKAVLSRARENGWTVCSGHLPTGSSMGKIFQKGGRDIWRPV